jgi:hypothetical protein
MRAAFLVLLLLTAATGCGLATHVRPTPKGQVELEAALGGPAAEVGGVPVIIPLSTVGASYGVIDRLDVSAHLHLTSLLLRTAGLDLGVTGLLVEQTDWPAFAISLRGYGFTDFTSFQPYAELDITGSYRFWEYFLVYGSAGAVGDYQGVGHATAALGLQLRLEHWSFQLEGRWYDITYDTRYASIQWLSLDGRGATGVTLGASYRFDVLR